METRKIYQSGGSTYIISLPKKWVESQDIKAGNSVAVNIQENAILIEPLLSREKESEAEIAGFNCQSSEALQRLIIAHYLAGFDLIKILLDSKTLKFKKDAKKTVDFLIGVELMEDMGLSMVVQTLLDDTRLPAIQVMRRSSSIVESMLWDAKEFLEKNDFALAKDIISRENEVDKLYFLSVRQLKSAVKYQQAAEKLQIKSRRDSLGYRIVTKSMERISDHIENIARSYLIIKEIDADAEFRYLSEFCENIINIYKKSIESIFNKDEKIGEQVFQDLKMVIGAHSRITGDLFKMDITVPNAVLQKTILDSLLRIANYSSDMAEIAINMAVEVPKTIHKEE